MIFQSDDNNGEHGYHIVWKNLAVPRLQTIAFSKLIQALKDPDPGKTGVKKSRTERRNLINDLLTLMKSVVGKEDYF